MGKNEYVREVIKYKDPKDFRKAIMDDGYDGIYSPDTNQGVVFPERVEKLKTKSQLTDIYNKAHNK